MEEELNASESLDAEGSDLFDVLEYVFNSDINLSQGLKESLSTVYNICYPR